MKARVHRAAWFLAIVLPWVWTWRHLAIEWRTNEQYEYGWGVPFLCLYMAWARWRGPVSPGQGRAWLAIVLAGWLAFALGELLRWHDPIWRLTAGLLAAGATLISIASFHRLGGLPLLRREAFPLAFAWTAVPWPLPLELVVTQNLLRFVTTFTITLLGLAGIPALQHGNAIELSNGVLGIDDACSGIRSLQAALMATLFLGEYFRLTPWQRVGLVAGGAIISFAFNCARVLTLALIFQRWGAATATQYHDTAGTIATAITFLAVFIFAAVFRDRLAEEPAAAKTSSASPGHGGVFICAALVAIPILAYAWFTSIVGPASSTPERPQWALDPASLPAQWRFESVEPRPGERSGLQFSTWQGYRVQSPEGWSAQVIHLGWKTGASMPSLAFYHTPALCMPWVGWTEVGQPQKMTLPLRTGTVPCVAYRFTQEGAGVLVLQSLSCGGKNGYHLLDPAHMENRWHRLLTLWQAPLRQVNEELLIYLPGLGDEDVQLRAATATMNALLVDPHP